MPRRGGTAVLPLVAGVRHGYRLTDHDAAPVARICRRLGGLPLALELVAARAHVLSVDDLAARLDQVLDLSARSPDVPARQQTLRQTMDWSYDQLPAAARSTFARLGVFAGTFSVPAAEAICADHDRAEVLDTLGVLVDHSLVQPQLDAGPSRFSLLEIVREYARSRLDLADAVQVQERHARYYREVAVAASTGLRGATQRQVLAGLDADADDVTAALDWLIHHGHRASAADMCRSMWLYYWVRGRLTEGRRWISDALRSPGPLSPVQRARLLASDGFLAAWQRDFGAALDHLHEALAIATRDGDDEVRMLAAAWLLLVYGGLGDEQQARSFGREGLRLARAHQDRWVEAEVLGSLCWLDAAFGHFDGEEPLFDEMLAAAQEIADPLTLANAFSNMSELRISQGAYAEAASLMAESIRLFAELRLLTNGAECLHGAAFLLAQAGQWSAAVRLQAAADATLQTMDAALWPPWIPRRERLLVWARQRIGDGQYEQAHAAGRTLSFDDAAEEATRDLAALAAAASQGGS